MSEEAAAHSERLAPAALQLPEEGEAVEVVELLQVAEDAATLAPQGLGHVGPLQQRGVVSHDVRQRAHVLPLRQQQLLHDPLQSPAQTRLRYTANGLHLYSAFIQSLSFIT